MQRSFCGHLHMDCCTEVGLRHEREKRERQRRSGGNDVGVKWDVNEARGELL